MIIICKNCGVPSLELIDTVSRSRCRKCSKITEAPVKLKKQKEVFRVSTALTVEDDKNSEVI